MLDFISSNVVVGAIVVFGLALLTSKMLWPLLSAPARIIGGFFKEGNCIGVAQEELWTCSAKVGLTRAAGPIVMIVIAMVFRRPIQKKIREVTKKISPKGRFLISPMMATSMFTMAYGDLHSDTAAANGYVNQTSFPAIVGTLTFLAVRLGPAITKKFPKFFAGRDKVPVVLRLLVALAVPVLLSLQVNKTSPDQPYLQDTAKKEQQVVLMSLLMAYGAVLPRSGVFTGGARTLLGGGGVAGVGRAATTTAASKISGKARTTLSQHGQAPAVPPAAPPTAAQNSAGHAAPPPPPAPHQAPPPPPPPPPPTQQPPPPPPPPHGSTP